MLRLRQAASSAEPGLPPGSGEPSNTVAIFLAVGATIRGCSLPVDLFEDLLSAFRQDVDVARYNTWAELLDYCRRSANPIGRLVLRISGRGDAQLDAWSDDICTALQLTNFWQDLKADYERGRVYLPREEQRLHGAREEDLAAGRITPAWQGALSAAVLRTRGLFEAGRPLCDYHARPVAVRASCNLARGHAHTRSPGPRSLRRCEPPACPRRLRCALVRLEDAPVDGSTRAARVWAPVVMSRDTSFYYSFWSCLRESAAPLSLCGTSAAPWTTLLTTPWTTPWTTRGRRCGRGGRRGSAGPSGRSIVDVARRVGGPATRAMRE